MCIEEDGESHKIYSLLKLLMAKRKYLHFCIKKHDKRLNNPNKWRSELKY
ncbi:unnamed protein product [Hymenolepis diminuta]|uniref:Uncharacterized protein n=1 Tax=Hymenolepis diminuta TaxID=6216 RepID=A0A564Z193_HYMDI|nr:unnamed protein product [Hymenolepis diminuta]